MTCRNIPEPRPGSPHCPTPARIPKVLYCEAPPSNCCHSFKTLVPGSFWTPGPASMNVCTCAHVDKSHPLAPKLYSELLNSNGYLLHWASATYLKSHILDFSLELCHIWNLKFQLLIPWINPYLSRYLMPFAVCQPSSRAPKLWIPTCLLASPFCAHYLPYIDYTRVYSFKLLPVRLLNFLPLILSVHLCKTTPIWINPHIWLFHSCTQYAETCRWGH